jgi:hypothetical protein
MLSRNNVVKMEGKFGELLWEPAVFTPVLCSLTNGPLNRRLHRGN